MEKRLWKPVYILTCSILLVSCGSESTNAAYCDALEKMYDANPASKVGVNITDEAELAYAQSIEDAAETAPSEESESLKFRASLVRADLDNQPQPELPDGYIQTQIKISTFAKNECGIENPI